MNDKLTSCLLISPLFHRTLVEHVFLPKSSRLDVARENSDIDIFRYGLLDYRSTIAAAAAAADADDDADEDEEEDADMRIWHLVRSVVV